MELLEDNLLFYRIRANKILLPVFRAVSFVQGYIISHFNNVLYLCQVIVSETCRIDYVITWRYTTDGSTACIICPMACL